MTSPTLAATGPWTPAGSPMPVAASWPGQHDGPVLRHDTTAGDTVVVAGGSDGTRSGALAASAVYDPAKDTWTALGNLAAARQWHTTTTVGGGKVLVTGGLPSGAAFPAPGLSSAELLDPAGTAWQTVSAMPGGPRWGHSAVLLADGTVLVTGGTTTRSASSVKALSRAEIYDPAADTWTAAPEMTDARSGHAAVVLADGRVLVTGGSVPIRPEEDAALAYCEIYDPKARTWTPAGTLGQPRSLHQATVVTATQVLVTGGSAPLAAGDGTFDPFSRRTAELFDTATSTFSAVADLPGGRARHRAVPVGTGQVLVIGGTGSAPADVGYQAAALFSVTTGTWTAAGALGTGRWGFGAVALTGGQRVVVTGGVVRSGQAAADPTIAELTTGTEIFTLGGGS